MEASMRCDSRRDFSAFPYSTGMLMLRRSPRMVPDPLFKRARPPDLWVSRNLITISENGNPGV
jgi:hypothetical protein